MYELNDIVLNLDYWTAQPENVSKDFTTLQKVFLAWCDSKSLQQFLYSRGKVGTAYPFHDLAYY